MKSLLLLPILSLFSFTNVQPTVNAISGGNNEYLVLDESNTVVGINSDYLDLTSYRIYSEYGDVTISGIASGVFDSCTASSISVFVSNGITSITSDAFNSSIVSEIYYSGSASEWSALNVTFTGTVNEYAYDEGFINYWNTNIRPSIDSNICDMSKAEYTTLRAMYDALESDDLITVNNYEDIAGEKIQDSMSYLKDYFSESASSSSSGTNMSQDKTIGIIVVIAVFGMTAISIFYLLKKNGVID